MTLSYSLGLTAGSLLAYALAGLLGPRVFPSCGPLSLSELCLTERCRPLLLATQGNGTRPPA